MPICSAVRQRTQERMNSEECVAAMEAECGAQKRVMPSLVQPGCAHFIDPPPWCVNAACFFSLLRDVMLRCGRLLTGREQLLLTTCMCEQRFRALAIFFDALVPFATSLWRDALQAQTRSDDLRDLRSQIHSPQLIERGAADVLHDAEPVN